MTAYPTHFDPASLALPAMGPAVLAAAPVDRLKPSIRERALPVVATIPSYSFDRTATYAWLHRHTG